MLNTNAIFVQDTWKAAIKKEAVLSLYIKKVDDVLNKLQSTDNNVSLYQSVPTLIDSGESCGSVFLSLHLK